MAYFSNLPLGARIVLHAANEALRRRGISNPELFLEKLTTAVDRGYLRDKSGDRIGRVQEFYVKYSYPFPRDQFFGAVVQLVKPQDRWVVGEGASGRVRTWDGQESGHSRSKIIELAFSIRWPDPEGIPTLVFDS